jgi:hypothetical protein
MTARRARSRLRSARRTTSALGGALRSLRRPRDARGRGSADPTTSRSRCSVAVDVGERQPLGRADEDRRSADALNARTGELTPPGMTRLRALERGAALAVHAGSLTFEDFAQRGVVAGRVDVGEDALVVARRRSACASGRSRAQRDRRRSQHGIPSRRNARGRRARRAARCGCPSRACAARSLRRPAAPAFASRRR